MVRTLDLFCGGGLSSAGARAAGAVAAGAIDLDPIAAATYKANFPEATVVNRRLEDVRPSELRDKIGDIDLLLASPECTNHTCAKGSKPRSEESRATAMQLLRYARAFEPRWIVMENVVHMRPWSRYPELIEEIKALGYNVKEQVIDASKLGVPQSRKRLFILCDREEQPTEIKFSANIKKTTVSGILDSDDDWNMSPLFKKGRATGTLARAKRAIKALGEDKSFLIVYYGTDGCGGWQQLNRPLRTVTTVDRFALVRPKKEGYMMRMLQVPELKRAMGLNSEFKMPIGTRRDKIRLLGNGVCAPVMKQVLKHLTVNH